MAQIYENGLLMFLIEGPGMERIAGISKYNKLFGIGPLALLISLLLLVSLWLLDRLLGHAAILNHPKPFRILGIAFIGIWIIWHSWAIKTVKEWWNRSRLCTSGPFRFVRHPMYAGGIFFADVGLVLILNSWILLFWPIFIYPIWSILVRKEEKLMESVFGEAYRTYASHTGRFIPRFFENRIIRKSRRIESE
jgi:protein-S-isoprenylcysteine O-methyltransferase Ste14